MTKTAAKKSSAFTGCITVSLILFAVCFLAIFYYTSTSHHISNLSSADVEKRRFAVDQLIAKGGSAGDAALKLAVDKSKEEESRRLAIFLLGQVRYAPAKDALLSIMQQESLLLRQQAAYSLGRLSDVSIIPQLASRYNSSSTGMRLKIVMGLGEAVGEAAKAGLPLLKIAAMDENELLRQSAEYAISQINKRSKNDNL